MRVMKAVKTEPKFRIPMPAASSSEVYSSNWSVSSSAVSTSPVLPLSASACSMPPTRVTRVIAIAAKGSDCLSDDGGAGAWALPDMPPRGVAVGPSWPRVRGERCGFRAGSGGGGSSGEPAGSDPRELVEGECGCWCWRGSGCRPVLAQHRSASANQHAAHVDTRKSMTCGVCRRLNLK